MLTGMAFNPAEESAAGQSLRLEAGDTNLPRGRPGIAWFTPHGGATVEVTLSCVEFEWRGVTYMPDYIPARAHGHDLFASGKAATAADTAFTSGFLPWTGWKRDSRSERAGPAAEIRAEHPATLRSSGEGCCDHAVSSGDNGR
jgi:hypothetical protein